MIACKYFTHTHTLVCICTCVIRVPAADSTFSAYPAKENVRNTRVAESAIAAPSPDNLSGRVPSTFSS